MATETHSKTIDAEAEPTGTPNSDRFGAETTHHEPTDTTHVPEDTDTTAESEPSESDMRELAYRLWEEDGHAHGRDGEHWAEARRRLSTPLPAAAKRGRKKAE